MIVVQPPVLVVARVNSDCADWGMSNADEFTHGTHDRNLNPATPAVYELYTYDNRSRLIGIQIKNSAHSLIDSHEYEYDAVSNIVERTSGGVTTEFGYDLVGQLISETRNGYSASYTYDANGNRLTRTVNNVTEEYDYDGADKLLEVSVNSETVKEFTYDAAGRTTAVTTSAGTTTLSWDYEDRLIGLTYPNQSTNSFSYNAFGARVSKIDSSGTSTYSRNGVSVVAPVLSDGSLTYTPGISTNDGSDSTWSHGDIKNSLRQTNSNESTSATKQYDAFGDEISSSGSWSGPFQYGGPFGYQTDEDSGLKLLGHRYYDSSVGRFISRDQAYHGTNWYSYCTSNPTSLTDPDGNAPIPLIVAGVLLLLSIPGDSNQNTEWNRDNKLPQVALSVATLALPVGPVVGALFRIAGAVIGKVAFAAALKHAATKIPSAWGPGEATRKGVGLRFRDPKNPSGNNVRIDRGNPNSEFVSQRVDHVVVTSGGRTIGRGGQPIGGSIKQFPEEAHIPLKDWLKWETWSAPKAPKLSR